MDWTAGGAAGDGAQLQGPESHSELQLPGHPAQASLRSLQLELHGPAGQRDQRPGHGRDSPGTERGGGGAGLTDTITLQCLPLYSLLLALGNPSLVMPSSREEIIQYMESQGYQYR